MTKFCPDCGEPIVGTNKFCKNCGRDISNLQPQTPQQSYAAPNPNVPPTVQNPNIPPIAQKDYTVWIIIGIIVSVIIPVIGPVAGMAIGGYIFSKKIINPKNETYGIIVLSLGLIIFVIEILFLVLVIFY